MKISDKKNILFDNDGVLVETEGWYYEASKRALKEFFDYDVTLERYMQLMTDGKGVWVDIDASKKEIIKARDQRDLYYREYLKSEELSIPNVYEVLKELSKKYKMGIVTTSRRVDFELIHKGRGITDFMEFVLCVEDYEKAKPHPDPYLKGLELFNCKKSEALVIEDSERGLLSANAAGIECAIVYNEFTKTQDFSSASVKVANLQEFLEIL